MTNMDVGDTVAITTGKGRGRKEYKIISVAYFDKQGKPRTRRHRKRKRR